MARASRKEPLGFGDRIDKLGNYFVYFNVYKRFNISFELFIEMVDNNLWADFIKAEQNLKRRCV